MLTESFQTIANATSQSLRNWRAMIVLAALYASLLATIYFFITIPEARTGQVVLSLGLALVAPVLFCALLTASASQPRSLGPVLLLRESLRNSWKVVLVSVPVIALALFAVYLLGKVQTYFGVGPNDFSNLANQHEVTTQNPGAQPLRWNFIMLITIRYLFLGVVLPIIAIHLWIASVSGDLRAAVRRIKQLVVRALAPDSVLIYMTGFLVFGLIPYLLLFSATPAQKAWLEIGLFVGRIGLIFLLSLFGWVITMTALAKSAQSKDHEFPEKL